MKLLDGVKADAVLSPDGVYRYALTRDWFPKARGHVLWIMLNPSTADADQDDATIRKVQKFSRAWGYDGVTVVNLFAYRAREPKDLQLAWVGGTDIVGPGNDATIEAYASAKGVGLIVAAWGANPMVRMDARGWEVQKLILGQGGPIHALDLTVGKEPRHPLYLKDSLEPRVWRAR